MEINYNTIFPYNYNRRLIAPVFCTKNSDYEKKYTLRGSVKLHKIKSDLVVCVDSIAHLTGIQCPLCGLELEEKRYSFELYVDSGEIYINLSYPEKPWKPSEVITALLAVANNKYKNPFRPSAYNNLEAYPIHIMPQLPILYEQFYDYINTLIGVLINNEDRQRKV